MTLDSGGTASINKLIQAQLTQMRDSYRANSREKLLALDWVETEPISLNGKMYYPAVWSCQYEDMVLLVVQITRWHFMRIVGTTHAIGFLLVSDGRHIDVDAEWLMNEIGHP